MNTETPTLEVDVVRPDTSPINILYLCHPVWFETFDNALRAAYDAAQRVWILHT